MNKFMLNLNLTNSDEILKSDFDELVKAERYEVYTEKSLLNYIKDKKDLELEKGITDEVEFPELKTLKRYIVLSKSGVRENMYIRKAEKGDLDDKTVEKGGEGSRGGNVIGHTKSGKPIYATTNARHEKTFTTQDHKDAAYAHLDHAEKLTKEGKLEDADQHSEKFDSHMDTARHREASGVDDSKVEKSDEDQLEKGGTGEGSRGGHIIGHTRSGKPIYDTSNHPSHKNFTKEDHLDASNLHWKKESEYEDKGDDKEAQKHAKASSDHSWMADEKRKENFEKSDKDELEKAGKGEGSRGGKVIGHTKSGKPVYEDKHPEDYKDFTKEDHQDAQRLHMNHSGQLESKANKTSPGSKRGEDLARQADKHSRIGMSHRDISRIMD